MIKDSAPSIEDQKINKLKDDIILTQHFENRIINVYLQLTAEINKLEKRIKALENGDTD
jgi:hypothetical protein